MPEVYQKDSLHDQTDLCQNLVGDLGGAAIQFDMCITATSVL